MTVAEPENDVQQQADDMIGPHRIVRCLAVTSTCEIDLGVTYGPFGFEREVVLKRILAGLDDDEVTRAAGRLLREAAALARLSHPAIVRLYELTEHRGLPVLVLEHVDGPSLATLLDALEANGAPLDDVSALYVGHRVFCALAAAHRACEPVSGAPAPVVHGDVAPGNVLVPWDGHVKLADFDLASGHGLGTPGFTAPERVRGGAASTRSDVFSACLLLRELLLRSGGKSSTEAPLSRVRPELHPGLIDAIELGLSLDPRGRTVSAAEIADRLRKVVDVESARERLSRHIRTFVRRSSPRQRVAVRPPPPPLEPAISVDVDLEQLQSEGDADVRLGAGVTVAVAISGTTPEPPGEAPEGLSSFRPTAVSVRPRPPESERGPLSALRTVKTARRRRQQAARVGAAVAGVVLAAACVLIVVLRTQGQARFGGADVPPISNAVAQESATMSVLAIPPAEERGDDDSTEPDVVVSGETPVNAATGDAGTTTGRILTDPGTSEHRVFVDGRPAGHGGTPVVVACGRHLVRIGSSGAAKTVDVPCGGEVAVGR